MNGGSIRRNHFADLCIVSPRNGDYIYPQGSHMRHEPRSHYEKDCAFCEGNEDQTMPAIWQIPAVNNHSDWSVRVIPHKNAAQKIEGGNRQVSFGFGDIIGTKERGARGAHEIIIESPSHSLELHQQPLDGAMNILLAYQERLSDLYEDPQIKMVTIFKNKGSHTGAVMTHPHTQVIGTCVIPPKNILVLEAARKYFKARQRCAWCDDINTLTIYEMKIRDEEGSEQGFEFKQGGLIVSSNEDVIAFAPFCAQTDWQVDILPREHGHDFRTITDKQLEGLAIILKVVLSRLEKALPGIPYNLFLRTAPNFEPERKKGRYDKWTTLPLDFHWGISILPTSQVLTGFETATGMSILTIAPEDWAKRLREITP